MYVYRTSNFDDELKKHRDLSLRVNSLCSKLQTSDLITAQERFERIHSYLKRKEGGLRLIAKVIKVDRETVLCFLKLYNRGESEYKHFLERVKHQNNLFQESSLTGQISKWLIEEKRKYRQVTNTILEEDLRIWLQRPDWKINTNEIIIYESELWSQKFSQPEIRSQASPYRQILEELINQISNNRHIGIESKWSNIYFYGRDNFYIIYSNLLITEPTPEQILLSIAPILGFPHEKVIDNLVETLLTRDLNLQRQHNLSLDDLITNTKRSYPWYLILDEKFWLRIQDGDKVNLALSTEEKVLLHSVSTAESLPLFLNGRAGSGKSTMLFYLFADYCYRHLQICHQNKQSFLAKPHPLFITYSPNLSDFAKTKVQSILKHHHHFLSETSDLETIPNLAAFFQPLRHFLLKLLPTSERNKFAEERYLSFHKFRELFNSRWQNLSAEKCWLVIQNFIKGYELIDRDTYLISTERYQAIPKKERTVTVEDFIEVRDRVWFWYYKYTRDNHLWDDRDLVRTVLAFQCYQPEYTVIFCDEAQDFTRLELQLIMSLSVFSLYDLEQETIFSLPFAFAGDPLQTLNPTGFRWASFQAAFHDKVLTPLKLTEKSRVQLQLQQLKYNYRSAAAIVKVNNLIQLWRKVLFDFPEIEPQQAKKYNNFIPQKFIIEDRLNLDYLQPILQDTIILIPCDEGAEREFISQDGFLSSLSKEETSEIPWHILSAISAKGLEFKQVILYRFGEACTLNLSNNLNNKETETTEEDKYFLNKLYVAASRATEKLFIIDSIRGENKLWTYMSDRDYLNYFLSQIEKTTVKQQWQENIELITQGNSLLEIGNNNIEADALTFATVGINTENITFLNRAIAAYQKLNNKAKTDLCLAWKLKLESNFLAAAKLFLTLDKVAEASICFWQAMAWLDLQQLVIERQNDNCDNCSELINFRSILPIINFMAQSSLVSQSNGINLSTQDVIEITNFLTRELHQNNLLEKQHSQPWQAFLAEYCDRVQKLFTNYSIIKENDWLKIARVLSQYLETNTTKAKEIIAHCLYFGKNYHDAIEYWEEIDYESTEVTESRYYYIAKAKLALLPQGLKYLEQGKQYKTIIYLWVKSGKKLETTWLEYVALSFIALEQYHHALTIYCQLNNLEQVRRCWQQIKHSSPTFTQYKQLIKYYLKHQHWDRAITFAEQEINLLQLKSYFIYRLANSKLKPDFLTKIQRQSYQSFIEQNFLNNIQWQQYITVEHLGIALEKIGSFMTTLTFYEQYVNSANIALQKFARDRWIITKQKQIKYFDSKQQTTKAQKSQQQLDLNAKKWNLASDSKSKDSP
jgi:hypothetical protein